MATTTNFGWATPDDTDLVKDGASAIRTLGSSIDTSFVDLKGGTTGQVLAKASNTDLDFVWSADAAGIAPTIFDAKGDLIAASAADTAARLAVGANGTVLTADSSETTGLKWVAPASAAASYSLINAGGTALTGAATITVTGISGMNSLYIRMAAVSSANDQSVFSIQLNTDGGANYTYDGMRVRGPTAYAKTNIAADSSAGATSFKIGQMSDNANSTMYGAAWINGANSTGIKFISSTCGTDNGSGQDAKSLTLQGIYVGTSAISSVSIVSSSGNFDAGTIFVYGSAN